MEEINTATPESVTAEASKNPIYDFLKKNNLTTKDEKSFIKEYSNPEKVRELHKFFSDNELTTKDFDSFYTDNFGGEKKKIWSKSRFTDWWTRFKSWLASFPNY